MSYMSQLVEFHEAFGHYISKNPISHVPMKVLQLRERLMKEELEELINSMWSEDIVGIADGLADLLYVVFGTAVSYGMPINEIFSVVHKANMAKLGLDRNPVNDSGGKTTKPAGWVSPNEEIKQLLEKKPHKAKEEEMK